MSSSRGRNVRTVATRNSPAPAAATGRRGGTAASLPQSPVSRRVSIRSTNIAGTSRIAIRQIRATTTTTAVAATCNSNRQVPRQALPPVVLGAAGRNRVPPTRSKPAAKPDLKRTAVEKPVDVSPTKKHHSCMDLMCPICFEDIWMDSDPAHRQVFSTNCGHLFCKPCILACLERSSACPICRRSQTQTDVHPIYKSEQF